MMDGCKNGSSCWVTSSKAWFYFSSYFWIFFQMPLSLSLSLSLSDSLGLSDSLSFFQYLSHFLIHLFFATACQVHYRSLRKIILKNGTSKKFLFLLLLVQTKNPNKSKKIFPNNPFWKRLFKGGSKRSSPRRGFGVKFTFLISVFHCFQVP